MDSEILFAVSITFSSWKFGIKINCKLKKKSRYSLTNVHPLTDSSVILYVLATAALISFKEMAASLCLKGLPLRNASVSGFVQRYSRSCGVCTAFFLPNFKIPFFVVVAVDFPVFSKFAAIT